MRLTVANVLEFSQLPTPIDGCGRRNPGCEVLVSRQGWQIFEHLLTNKLKNSRQDFILSL